MERWPSSLQYWLTPPVRPAQGNADGWFGDRRPSWEFEYHHRDKKASARRKTRRHKSSPVDPVERYSPKYSRKNNDAYALVPPFPPGYSFIPLSPELGKILPTQLSPLKIADSVTRKELVRSLFVVAICVFLCLCVMVFHWLLDFGLDVLHYGGDSQCRASLIDRTANTIRWFYDQEPNTPIIVVGHSLGSVIASQAIASIVKNSEPCLRQIVLVTLGSPLNYLNRLFPESVGKARALSEAICASVRWINLWRRHDIVGKELNIEATGMVQYCVGSGGHANYWSDGNVWRAVAREALGLSDGADRRILSTRGACLFERCLGPLVFSAITVMALCSAGFWVISP